MTAVKRRSVPASFDAAPVQSNAYAAPLHENGREVAGPRLAHDLDLVARLARRQRVRQLRVVDEDAGRGVLDEEHRPQPIEVGDAPAPADGKPAGGVAELLGSRLPFGKKG